MEITGEYRISAEREVVWFALNDADILRRAIPGCRAMEKRGETSYTATVLVKIGPVKTIFKGEIELSELNPPISYIIFGEGKGGAAGFAKGGAKVNLSEAGSDTILRYEVNAQVGGKLMQIGQRLIDLTAKKMASDFFKTFTQLVSSGGSPAEAKDQPVISAEQEYKGLSSWAWMGGLIFAALLITALADRLTD